MNKLERINFNLWNILFVLGKVFSLLAILFLTISVLIMMYASVTNTPALVQNFHVSISGIDVSKGYHGWMEIIVGGWMIGMLFFINRSFESAHLLMKNFKLIKIFDNRNLNLLKNIIFNMTIISVMMLVGLVLIGLLQPVAGAFLLNELAQIIWYMILFNSFMYLLYSIFKYGLSIKTDSDLLI